MFQKRLRYLSSDEVSAGVLLLLAPVDYVDYVDYVDMRCRLLCGHCCLRQAAMHWHTNTR